LLELTDIQNQPPEWLDVKRPSLDTMRWGNTYGYARAIEGHRDGEVEEQSVNLLAMHTLGGVPDRRGKAY